MDNAILNKLMNLLISLARDVVVPPLDGTMPGGGTPRYDNLPPTHNNYVSDCIPTARIQYAIYVRVIYCLGSGSAR